MALPKTIAAATKSRSRSTKKRPKAPKMGRGGGTRRGY